MRVRKRGLGLEAIRAEIVGRFVALRRQYDLSQNQVAKDCRIPQTTISSWENDKIEATPNVAQLVKICDRYGWNPLYLLLGEGPPLVEPDDLTERGSNLQGQQLMLARVEQALQAALSEVRQDLLTRLERAGDVAAVGAVQQVASPPGQPRKRTGRP